MAGKHLPSRQGHAMRQFPASPITELIDGSPQYNLAESYAPHLSVADILDPAEVAGLSLGYGTSAGDAELRALIAGRLGVPDEQVLLTAGTSATLFLVGPLHSDGEILVGRPCFPPMLDALGGLGAAVATVTARFEDGYRVDLDAFRDGLSARTRLVMVASPQNPSGVSITRDEVAAMLAAMSPRCPDAGAFCCARLNPDIFGPADVRRFYDRLGERRTVVAPGPWFGDSAHVIRIGLAYPPEDDLEKGLAVISDALNP